MARAFLIAAVVCALGSTSAWAAPARTAALAATAPSFTWDGVEATGANTSYDPAACSGVPTAMCDQTLLEVSGPAGATGELKVSIGSYSGPHCMPLEAPRGPCDFSLRLYASDAAGKPGRELAASAADSGFEEAVTLRRAAPGFYLAVVFYYSVVQASYKGTATLKGLSVPAPAPPGTAGPAVAFPSAGALTSRLAVRGRASARGGVPLRLTCSIVCRGTVLAELSASQARRLGLGRRRLVVGSRSIAVTSAEGTHAVLKLSSRYVKRLARARGVKLTVRARLSDTARTQRTAPRASARLTR